MSWFKKPKTRLQATDKRELPGDVWDKCPSCGEILYREKLRENWFVCPQCGYHIRLPAVEYVSLLLDADTIRYRATLTDEEDFTRPWTIETHLYRHKDPAKQILEYECHAYAEDDAAARPE